MEKPSLASLPLMLLDPAKIEADAATYQFRRKGDANGVTESHKVQGDKWDNILLGDALIVHEKRDGRMFVADGHHRLAFAKQLAAEGKEAPRVLPAYVLREADGFSAEDAKIIAAYKNIQHDSNDVVETAQVFKEARSGKVHMDLLPSLQMDKGNLKLAYTLSGLSDASLAKVDAGFVPADVAVMVAEQVRDTAMQDQTMAILGEKFKQEYPAKNPFTAIAAEMKPKANDNITAGGFLERVLRDRAAKAASKGLGAA